MNSMNRRIENEWDKYFDKGSICIKCGSKNYPTGNKKNICDCNVKKSFFSVIKRYFNK